MTLSLRMSAKKPLRHVINVRQWRSAARPLYGMSWPSAAMLDGSAWAASERTLRASSACQMFRAISDQRRRRRASA